VSARAATRSSSPAAPQRGFDADLAALEALSESIKAGAGLDAGALDSAALDLLRKALNNRNNFLVSKAARLVADAEAAALLPEVLAAYERFFHDPAKTDPKCWAKEALAKALVKLEHRGKDVYLRGLRHHQMEASWGPPVDSAGGLRATCAHALVVCPGIPDDELVALLLETLVDTDKSVRVEAARAIGNVGGRGAALALRLRALMGPVKPDLDTPEVLGAVYAALLSLEGVEAIPLVAAQLEDGDDLAGEAAFALAETRLPEALAALTARLIGSRVGGARLDGAGLSRTGHGEPDAWFAGVLVSAIAMTRLPEAFDFLIRQVERESRHAPAALEAMGRIAPSAELRARIEKAVEGTGSDRLRDAFQEHFSDPLG
jgi:HEAT repeat protein